MLLPQIGAIPPSRVMLSSRRRISVLLHNPNEGMGLGFNLLIDHALGQKDSHRLLKVRREEASHPEMGLLKEFHFAEHSLLKLIIMPTAQLTNSCERLPDPQLASRFELNCNQSVYLRSHLRHSTQETYLKQPNVIMLHRV